MSNNYIRRQFSDTVSYTDELNGGINNSVTSFTLKDGSTFPTGSVGPFVVTIDPDTGTEEKVLCLSRSGSTVTVVSSGGRGFGGTTAVAHNANATVIHTICAQDLDEANQAVVQTIGRIAASGDLLYGSSANTTAKLSIGTANQVLSSSGTVPQWSTLLGLIEDQFTAANQVVLGTGSGTGALTDLLTAIGNKFGAAGQLVAGTGSGTGELLSKGSAGTSLTVGGADASGLEWIQVLGAALGLTGATATTRFAGGTASGAPASGTFALGDFVVDQTGIFWICTTAGSPGTWTQVGSKNPSWSVHRAAAFNTTSPSSTGALYDTTDWDTDSQVTLNNAGSTVVTISKPGYYRVTGTIAATGTASGVDYLSASIYQNGSAVRQGPFVIFNGAGYTLQGAVTALIKCSTNDTLSIGYTSSRVMVGVGTPSTYFDGVRVSL